MNDDSCGFVCKFSILQVSATLPNRSLNQVGQISLAVNKFLLHRQMFPHSKASNPARTLQRRLERDPSMLPSHFPLSNRALPRSGKESWKRRLQSNRHLLAPILKHGRLTRPPIVKRGPTTRKPCGHVQLHKAAHRNSRCLTAARVMEPRKCAHSHDISKLTLNLYPESFHLAVSSKQSTKRS
jgi:hypothetical protein